MKLKRCGLIVIEKVFSQANFCKLSVEEQWALIDEYLEANNITKDKEGEELMSQTLKECKDEECTKYLLHAIRLNLLDIYLNKLKPYGQLGK